MTRWRSPRQRRDAVRRRRDQAARAEARELIKAARAWYGTDADQLAASYGVHVHEVPSRRGPAVEAIADGWRVMGPLAEVRAELEYRRQAAGSVSR